MGARAGDQQSEVGKRGSCWRLLRFWYDLLSVKQEVLDASECIYRRTMLKPCVQHAGMSVDGEVMENFRHGFVSFIRTHYCPPGRLGFVLG